MYDYETLDLRLMKSWIWAYKILEQISTEETSKWDGWMWDAIKLRQALFTSRDPDNQAILDKLWESVII